MRDCDYSGPWYHGSNRQLTTLRTGSSITQNRDLARAFSHKPSLLGQSNDGRIQHNGQQPGYLGQFAESVSPGDIYPHPHPINASQREWLARRKLTLQFLEITTVSAIDLFTQEDMALIRRRQKERGEDTFADDNDLR